MSLKQKKPDRRGSNASSAPSDVSVDSKRGILRNIINVIDDSNNGTNGNPQNVVWFDLRTIKQYNLKIGQYIHVKLSSDNKEIKYERIAAKIDCDCNMRSKSVCVSELLMHNLQLDIHLEVASAPTRTLLIYLHTLKHHSQFELSNIIKIIPEVPLGNIFTKHVEECLLSNEDVVYQLDCLFIVYMCEKCIHFKIKSDQDGQPLNFRLSSLSKIKITNPLASDSKSSVNLTSGYKNTLLQIQDLIVKTQTTGILLVGESGSGKSHLVKSLMSTLGSCMKIIHADFTSDPSLADPSKIKSMFDVCVESELKHSIIIIDALNALDLHSQIHQLVTCMDIFSHTRKVTVIGIADKVTQVDSLFRRVGRFEYEFELKVPDSATRMKLLSDMIPNINKIDANVLVDATQGFIAADLLRLSELVNRSFLMGDADCNSLIRSFKPSSHTRLDDSSKLPSITLSDLAGIDNIKEQLRVSVLLPLQKPREYIRLGVPPPRGILLYGPPGVGKTTLACAIARECGVNFVNVTCPDIMSKYVGQSSRTLSNLFAKARSSSPCILFFDQFESLARKRGTDGSESQSADRTLSTLLIEMDGISKHNADQHVIVLCATSRIDLLDPAVLRPGRIDVHIKIPLPDQSARRSILEVKSKGVPILDRENVIKNYVDKTEGWDGSRLENLCREAAMMCLRSDINNKKITSEFFEKAFDQLNKKSDK
ncbi:cell division cycle protein CDC48 [Acrasis kona]|uniref:Cell division cycle protein CDC48 n=1 Tax=Acrasis kona TaxID=1008807 RepID=A0AAW2ZI00_9EUKA